MDPLLFQGNGFRRLLVTKQLWTKNEPGSFCVVVVFDAVSIFGVQNISTLVAFRASVLLRDTIRTMCSRRCVTCVALQQVCIWRLDNRRRLRAEVEFGHLDRKAVGGLGRDWQEQCWLRVGHFSVYKNLVVASVLC